MSYYEGVICSTPGKTTECIDNEVTVGVWDNKAIA